MLEFQRRARIRRRKKARVTIFFFVLIFTIVLSLSLKLLKTNQPSFLISPLGKSIEAIKDFTENPLERIVKNDLIDNETEFGVFIKNLKTGEKYSFNENKKFQSASLYKLWVMGTAFEKIEAGEIKESDVLKDKIELLNEKFKIATEEAELKEGDIESKIDNAIYRMITISDNYSALLLTSKIRNANISSFLEKNGFIQSKLGSPPTTTAADIALFFEKLYKGEVVSKDSSLKMIDILKRQRLNDRIPKYLPEIVGVAHKTGELNGSKHDAGIIFSKQGDYILVVLSQGKDPSYSAERIANFSKKVFTYFENKNKS